MKDNTSDELEQTNELRREVEVAHANICFLFNGFIRKAVPDLYAHYVDTDDNLAERVRRSMMAVMKDMEVAITQQLNEAERRGRIDELNTLQRHHYNMDGGLLLVIEERLCRLQSTQDGGM